MSRMRKTDWKWLLVVAILALIVFGRLVFREDDGAIVGGNYTGLGESSGLREGPGIPSINYK
jgi:hypothetical protein